MEEKIRVFEIKKTFTRVEEDNERIIFEYDKELKQWLYVAPNMQKHTEEQLDQIYARLKILNKELSQS